MFRIALFFLFSISCQAGVFDWFSPLSPKAKRLQKLVETYESAIDKALVDYQVPGIALGIVVDGELAYAKGFGFSDIEARTPVTASTVFAIGSCSKAFTSFVAGTLIDEGHFSWDDRVVHLLPEFQLYDEYATIHLRMRDLLTHRSGMPRHDFMWYNSSTMTRADIMQRLRYLESSCDIRERYQYNNLMYLAAGYAMEHLTTKTWVQNVF